MYFGLTRIGLYPFVPVGTGIVLLWALLLGLVYAVGTSRGGAVALRYFRVVLWGGLAVLVITLAWAVATGQWQRFIAEFGWQPMAEMLVLAFLLVFTMAWMGMTYVSSKLREEQAESPDSANSAPSEGPAGRTVTRGGDPDDA